MNIKDALLVFIFMGMWLTAMSLQEPRILSKPCVDVRLDGPDDYASWKGK